MRKSPTVRHRRSRRCRARSLMPTRGQPRIWTSRSSSCTRPTATRSAAAIRTTRSPTPRASPKRRTTAKNAIRTYVIGVGPNLDDLNQIASSGGTDQAMLLDTTKDFTAELAARLAEIRSAVAVDCVYNVPAAPAGQNFDGRVNVNYTSGRRRRGADRLQQRHRLPGRLAIRRRDRQADQALRHELRHRQGDAKAKIRTCSTAARR